MQSNNNLIPFLSKLNEPVRSHTALTPVEEYDGVYYKRDDLFMPYPDVPISGGKVRQAISLFEHNYDLIKTRHNNSIATSTNIESPQGIIIARVAREFKLRCILGIGGGTTQADADKAMQKHSFFRGCHENGAELRPLSKFGYTNVMYSKLAELQKKENFYLVRFGINVDSDPDAILGSTSRQVENLPLDKLHRIVVPVGSGLMFTAILISLQNMGWLQYPDNECIGIQIDNIDRRKIIDGLLARTFFMRRIRYKQILDTTYKYHTHVKSSIVGTDHFLDPIYEAKAHEFALKHNLLTKGTLFWIVGNSIPVREFYKG